MRLSGLDGVLYLEQIPVFLRRGSSQFNDEMVGQVGQGKGLDSF